MDTVEEVISGRGEQEEESRPRRMYTIAQKRAILEQTRQSGSSVALVAKRHAIHTSLIFGWRRLLRKGLLSETATNSAPLLPVKVTTPTMLPGKRAKSSASAVDSTDGSLEVELAGGHRVRLKGLDGPTMVALVTALSHR